MSEVAFSGLSRIVDKDQVRAPGCGVLYASSGVSEGCDFIAGSFEVNLNEAHNVFLIPTGQNQLWHCNPSWRQLLNLRNYMLRVARLQSLMSAIDQQVQVFQNDGADQRRVHFLK